MDFEKFRAGVDAGRPKKPRLNLAGDYSSGSHELHDDAQDFPSPPSFTRRTRPVVQKRAQRGARSSAHGSQGPVGIPPTGQLAAELSRLARQQTQVNMWKIIGEWRVTTVPVEKGFLLDLLQSMQADLAAARREAGDAGDSDAADLRFPGSGDEE